jgi:methyltransferase
MLALALAAQALRYWAIASLGKRWNVRVITIPGMPLSAAGPYRFLRHPNYLAVVLEGIAIPLVHTAYLTALGFTLLNGLMLALRIRCEERASIRTQKQRADPKPSSPRQRRSRAEPSARAQREARSDEPRGGAPRQ